MGGLSPFCGAVLASPPLTPEAYFLPQGSPFLAKRSLRHPASPPKLLHHPLCSIPKKPPTSWSSNPAASSGSGLPGTRCSPKSSILPPPGRAGGRLSPVGSRFRSPTLPPPPGFGSRGFSLVGCVTVRGGRQHALGHGQPERPHNGDSERPVGCLGGSWLMELSYKTDLVSCRAHCPPEATWCV